MAKKKTGGKASKHGKGKRRGKRKVRRRTGRCIYCGEKGLVTKDHIPPKNLFKRPHPSDLITVPSCADCNEGAAKDDEYFRVMLSMRYDTFEHKEMEDVWPRILTSFQRPQGRGLTKSILANMHEVAVHSPGGIYLGQGTTYNVNMVRVGKVIARTMKGLFFHELRKRLPSNFGVVSYCLENFKRNSEALRTSLQKLIPFLEGAPLKIVGDKVFSYRFRNLTDAPNAAIAYMLFYGVVPFIAFTVEKNQIPRVKNPVL